MLWSEIYDITAPSEVASGDPALFIVSLLNNGNERG
jgi:hypothetical protein